MQDAMMSINQASLEFMKQAAEKMTELESELKSVKERKGKQPVRIEAKREKGKLVAIPVYED